MSLLDVISHEEVWAVDVDAEGSVEEFTIVLDGESRVADDRKGRSQSQII